MRQPASTIRRRPASWFTDRAYQRRGVSCIVAGLAEGGRGQLRAACGTGKTKIGLWSAQRLVSTGGIVVVTVPTVGLVGQTLSEWAQVHPDHTALAVCSDHTVAEDLPTAASESVELDEVGLGDILEPVTTDSDVVAAWLRRPTTSALRLIVGTHKSAHVIGEGLQQAATEAELLIVDEAHRTAGHADKRSAVIHDDDVLPARRRLYMTATPRVFTAGKNQIVVSMDDESVFGPILFDYPFSEAIKDGYLDDYRLLVVGVTKAEVLAVLRTAAQELSPKASLPTEHAAMVQAAIARAAVHYDLRRVLAFCPRVADAKEFADTFADTMRSLPPRSRPARPVHARHVSGYMKHKVRREILATLATPPDDGWSIISNARCLAEGIDVPAVDAVAFTAPKESTVDIVQAIGRALRLVPGQDAGVATILVPILLDTDRPDGADVDMDNLDAKSFALLLQVASGLRSHDDQFATALHPTRARRYLRGETLDKTEALTPSGIDATEFLQHLTVQLVRSTNSPWWDGYRELVAFSQREGHANPKTTEKALNGFPLGQWLATACADYRNGRLTQDRIDALTELGAVLHRRHKAAWDRQYDFAARFFRDNGHLRLSYSGKNARLYGWVAHQRRRRKAGTIPDHQIAALDAIGMEWEAPTVRDRDDPRARYEKRAAQIRQLGEYFAEHGELPRGAAAQYTFRTILRNFRAAFHEGELEPEFVDQLAEWGMNWNSTRAANRSPSITDDDIASAGPEWLQEGFRQLEKYHDRHGNAIVDPAYVTTKGFELGRWATYIRFAYHSGSLATDSMDVLAKLEFPLAAPRDKWEPMYALAKEYAAKHGTLRITKRAKVNGAYLGEWLWRQRGAATVGRLSQERKDRLSALDENWMQAPTPKPASSRSRKPRSGTGTGTGSVQDWVDKLRAYHAEHGRLPLVTEGGLGAKISQMRTRYRAGELSAEIIAEMNKLGMTWAPYDDAWQRAIAAATRFSRHHGHLDTRYTLPDYQDTVDPDFDLDKWVKTLRAYLHQGKLTVARIKQLERLGMVWTTRRVRRSR